VLLAVVGVGMVVPFLWMILTSLKSPEADVMDLRAVFPEPAAVLAARQIRQPDGLVRRITDPRVRSQPATPAGRLWSMLEEPDHQALLKLAETPGPLDPFQVDLLVEVLNTLLTKRELYEPTVFPVAQLPADVPAILRHTDGQTGQPLNGLKHAQVLHLNRRLLEWALPDYIEPGRRVTLVNYQRVFQETNFGRALFNSIVVTLIVTFGQVFTSSLAAFAFARLRFTGRDKLFFGYLATMMIPGSVTMIPVFILLRHLGWIDSYAALILPVMFTAYGTFMLRQFFMGLPTALEEAAVLDGCGMLRIYWHVALPLSKPALAALGILTFMGAWRSFMWPLIVAHSPEHYTLPVAIAQFQGMFGTEWTLLMAGAMIMIVPMLIVFAFGQRYFVSGIRVGAVKE